MTWCELINFAKEGHNIRRNFVFRKIQKEVLPVNLRGEAFPALFLYILRMGFTNFETPCDVPDSVLAFILVTFSSF